MPITIEDIMLTDQRRQRKRGCFGCGEIRHFVEDCSNRPKPTNKKKGRREKCQALKTIKTWDDTSSEEENKHKKHDHKSLSSSSHICLVAKGKTKSESDVSSNEDSFPSYDDHANLLDNFKKHEQQSKIKELK